MLPSEKMNPSTTEADNIPSAFTWPQVEHWEAELHQQISSAAEQGQAEILTLLTQLLQQKEADRASFAQKVVSDFFQNGETPAQQAGESATLPDHHPAYWVQSRLDSRSQGIFEYATPAAAEQSFQEIRDYLRPEIGRVMATLQKRVSDSLDLHVQSICQSLAISIAPQMAGQPVVLSEYINSYVPLPRIDVRAVERFSYFYQDKRLVAKDLVQEVTRTVSPWYLGGLGSKEQVCYQIAHQQIIDMVDESLQRSARVIWEQVEGYVKNDLRGQIDRLLASVE
jgi:hypothetical protein